MTLRKLDQTKPPPGWYWYALTGYYMIRHTCGRNERTKTHSLEEAHQWAAEDAQPYIDDALARLVEWLRGKARGKDGTTIANKLDASYDVRLADALADAIEQGEWRND
jgi:hypothetical protein